LEQTSYLASPVDSTLFNKQVQHAGGSYTKPYTKGQGTNVKLE